MAMATPKQQLHFLLVPLMSQSHLIPFTDMAKVLALHGLTVSIVMSHSHAVRFRNIVDYARNLDLRIQLVSLQSFPSQDAGFGFGLPEVYQNMDAAADGAVNIFEESNLLEEPLEKWLQQLETRPNCIVSDFCLPWTSDLAVKFNIPRVVFHTVSCFTLFCAHNVTAYKVHEKVMSDSQPFVVPDMPDRIEFKKAQLPSAVTKSSDDTSDSLSRFQKAERSASGLLLNSFEELEPKYVQGYKKAIGKKNLWCIGPLSLCNKTVSNKFERGNKASINENACLNWLDSKKPSSVIYVCFGSLSRLSTPQLVELGLGLEASNCPFIWIIKKLDCSEELEKWFQEQKFEERLRGRGLIIRGWAPQVLILSHQATGGFLTHCGWNSTLEGVSAGVPMITWPMFAEQFYNEKLIVEVLRIGVRIGVEKSVPLGEGQKAGVMVKKEDVQKAIEKLTDEGEKGEDRRKRARELGEMAKMAVEEGGSSYNNITLLVEHVIITQQQQIELVSHVHGKNGTKC